MPQPDLKPASGRRSRLPRPLNISLLYLLYSALWIFYSDRIAAGLAISKEQLLLFSRLKGWFFIGISALLLYLVLRRDARKIKAHAEQLSCSEEKYRALFNNAPLPYQSLNEDGHFIDVNPAWLRILGYERDEVIGQWFGAFLHPDYVQHFNTNFPAFKKRGYVKGVQFRIRHKNGSYRHIEFEGCIGYLPDGSFRQTYCVFMDITERKKAEQQLIASEERFRQICESAPVLINGFDEHGHCTMWNRQCRETFGWTIDEINAHDDALALFYPDPDIRREVMQTVTTDPDGQFREWHPQTRDGRILTTVWANFRLPNDQVYSIGHDITEQRKTEEALKKTLHEQQVVLDHDPAFIIFKDTQNNIIRISNAVAELTGMPREQIEGRPAKEIYPDMADQYYRDDLAVMRSAKPKRGIIEKLPAADGTTKWLMTDKVPYLDEHKNPLGIFVFSSDITQLKQMELAQREITLNLQSAIRAGNVGFWEWDLKTNKSIYSKEWAAQIGCEQGELEQDYRAWKCRIHADDLASVLSIIEQTINQADDHFEAEYRFRHKNGTYRWVLAQATTHFDDHHTPIKMIVTHIDITERREFQEELTRHRDQLEERVDERTRELQQIINTMAGRENRMAELKQIIVSLRARLRAAGLDPQEAGPPASDEEEPS